MAANLKLAEAVVEVRADLTQLIADLARARSMLGGLGGGAGAGGVVGQSVASSVARGMTQGVASGSRGAFAAGSFRAAVQDTIAAPIAQGMAAGMAQGTRDAQGRLRDVFGRFVGGGGGSNIRRAFTTETTGLGLGQFLGIGGGGGGGAGAGAGGGGGFLGRVASSAGGMLMARGIGAAMAVPGQIGGALFDAADKAADLGESVSKVGVTFGPAAKDVIGQSDMLAERFGVVKRASLDAAAAFGLMGQAAGQTKQESAALGNRFVRMGLDLASFHNITNEEAFEKLRSGLSGEIEPLRSIGILLSEDAIQAKALSMGLVGTAKEAKNLTQGQKVIARTAVIEAGMGPAEGDLERTIDSAKNQMKRLAGDIENTTVEFGKELQGALSSGITLARELGGLLAGVTGKGAPKAVGELVQAGIDDARTAVSGEGAGFVGRLNMKLGEALSSTFKVLGLGENFLGVKDTLTQMQREQEEAVGQATGKKLEAGPATVEEQVAKMKASGDPKQLARAAEIEGILKAQAEAATGRILEPGATGSTFVGPVLDFAREQDRKQREMLRREEYDQGEGLDERMNLELGRQFARPGGIPEVSEFRRKFMGPEEREALERQEAVASLARPKEPERRPSEMFADSADYATNAIQTALSGKDDTGKATVEQLKIGNTLTQILVDKLIPTTAITPGKPNSGPLIFRNE